MAPFDAVSSVNWPVTLLLSIALWVYLVAIRRILSRGQPLLRDMQGSQPSEPDRTSGRPLADLAASALVMGAIAVAFRASEVDGMREGTGRILMLLIAPTAVVAGVAIASRARGRRLAWWGFVAAGIMACSLALVQLQR